jgi:hypothetical protein
MFIYNDAVLLGFGFCPEDGDSMALRNVGTTDKSIRGQNPEEQHHHPHRRENLRSHMFIYIAIIEVFVRYSNRRDFIIIHI